jgi:hypothetical protein
MKEDKYNIKTIIPFFEIKGTFSYENKNTMVLKKPVIIFASRFKEVTNHINTVLTQYDIKHNYMIRKKMYIIRITYIVNCHRFTRLIKEDIRFRKKVINEMYEYCEKNDKNSKF